MKFKVFGLSDIGVSRANNEDVYAAMPEIGFFALADGMGGHKAGEVAAKEAIDHLCSYVQKIKTTNTIELIVEIKTGIEKANSWVYKLGRKSKAHSGMGTTLCCTLWTKDTIIYAHVGDSRIYRLRDQKLELLTEDHSLFAKWLATGKLAEQCETPFPYKNVITRAVGTAPRALPEVTSITRLPGDLFFLCTDGLSDHLSLTDIEKIINHSSDLEQAAHNLIHQAKIKGSSDNITILMIKEEHESEDLLRQQLNDSPRSEGVQSDAGRPLRSPSESL
jgi:PPM family protein phosphatase